MAKYGYFSEQLPPCFNSKSYSDNIDTLVNYTGDMTISASTQLSIYKNETARRIISVPNPREFARSIQTYKSKWNEIKKYANSENSQSSITRISKDYGEFINAETFKDKFRIKSDLKESLFDSIKKSVGYKYCLILDIANCYNSIYTHSISWAICGKTTAQRMYREKSERDNNYNLSAELDKHMRYLKNNETNGIIVGPYISRIFSELLLARIDKELRNEGFKFTRYVDDYKFFFRTELEARLQLPKISRILSTYNLSLNESKTKIVEFPYNTFSDINTILKNAYDEDSIFGVLNKAGELHNSGEKGAYKYALKMISNKEIPSEQIDIVLPLLVNIMLLDPKYGKFVISHIKKNIDNIGKDKLRLIIKEELANSADKELQQESLLFLHFARDLEISISGESVLKILKNGDDFSKIIVLDLWKNHKNRIIRNEEIENSIELEIEFLYNELKKYGYNSEHWLILYESEMHNFNPNQDYEYPEKDSFFKKMQELNVSFYS